MDTKRNKAKQIVQSCHDKLRSLRRDSAGYNFLREDELEQLKEISDKLENLAMWLNKN